MSSSMSPERTVCGSDEVDKRTSVECKKQDVREIKMAARCLLHDEATQDCSFATGS